MDTIGDAVVAVSGMPEANNQHASSMANCALAIQRVVQNVKNPRTSGSVEIRIGLDSGPITSAVVGFRTPKYSIFGDVVNTASRMESTGVPSRIQISPATATLLHQAGYTVSERGEVEVKGKGKMTTSWLQGPNTASEDLIQDCVSNVLQQDAESLSTLSLIAEAGSFAKVEAGLLQMSPATLRRMQFIGARLLRGQLGVYLQSMRLNFEDFSRQVQIKKVQEAMARRKMVTCVKVWCSNKNDTN